MTNPVDSRREVDLLHPYVDGELDAASSLAFERRMAEDPALAAECGRLKALRRELSAALSGNAAPASLRQRVAALAEITPPKKDPVARRWLSLAAAAGLAAVIGGGSTYLALQPAPADPVPVEVVAGHVRSLLAAQPVDVVSSDRHTVRPWFAGKLAMSPVVRDLASAGYPLIGGRIDYVGRRTVAALVYRHREHTITLYEWPAERKDGRPRNVDLDGYALLAWTDGGVAYWAVSDIDRPSLESFRRLLMETATDAD